MIPVMCVVQQGQISTETESAMKVEICEIVQKALNSMAKIDWIEVPKGSGFTAAKPSNAVITSVYADRPLAEIERNRLLQELRDTCASRTGKSLSDVVAYVRDPT